MRRISILLMTGCVVSSGLIGSWRAAAASGTTCKIEHLVSVDPGLSVQGSSGTFEDKVLGTVNCDGPLKGITPTGTGTFHDQGRYGTEHPASCLEGGQGEGAYTMVFPTADGERTVVLPFTLKFGDPHPVLEEGPVGVHTKGDGWIGEFGGTPKEGDCVSKPVTKILAKGKIVFS
jgi:hypothetical protein